MNTLRDLKLNTDQKQYNVHMKQVDIIPKIQNLKLPTGQYVVFGSGPIGVRGIREINDLDIVVTPEVYAKIKKQPGWKEITKPEGNLNLVKEEYEIMADYNVGVYNPDTKKLIAKAELIDGVPFVPLNEVLVWKNASRRPKDLVDIELINTYLASHPPAKN